MHTPQFNPEVSTRPQCRDLKFHFFHRGPAGLLEGFWSGKWAEDLWECTLTPSSLGLGRGWGAGGRVVPGSVLSRKKFGVVKNRKKSILLKVYKKWLEHVLEVF